MIMLAFPSRLGQAALCGLLLVAASGCTSLGPMPEFKLPFTGKKEKICKQPTRIAVTWSPDVLVQAGATPTRGFGGRIFFYDNSGQTVHVDGDLMVHAFGNNGSTPGQSAKRYAFTPEQFKGHVSESDIGDSYSVWIPWDAAGGMQQRITLVATFTPADGTPIQSGASVALLPGRTPDTSHAAHHGVERPQISQVSHFDGDPGFALPGTAAAAAEHSLSRGLSTTTIPLPSSTQKLLRNAPDQSRVQRYAAPPERQFVAPAPQQISAPAPQHQAMPDPLQQMAPRAVAAPSPQRMPPVR